jgi:protein-disulfide isomerase
MAAPAPSGLKRFYLVLAVVAAIGVGAMVFMSQRKAVSIPVNPVVVASDTSGFSGYILGSADAPVEVVVYADYQCPACGGFDAVQFPSVRERLIATGRVRWRYRDFPLDNLHPQARLAAHAAACANDQGKYWEMHRFIYEAQNDWAFKSDAVSQLRNLAKPLGIDMAQYDACMQSAKYAGRIQASLDEGTKLGVPSTPTFVIGGRRVSGNLPYDALKHIVDSIAPVAPAPTQ